MDADEPFEVLAIGPWLPADVTVSNVPDTRPIVPAVEALIDQAWRAAASRLGDKLFDGPMCRLERLHPSGGRLHLDLSPTSYRPFLGTNLSNPHLADQYGNVILANSVGVSTALITADEFFLLGLRGDGVAYYPGRIHPFAGSLEAGEASAAGLFAAPLRELHEELNLAVSDTIALNCIGLARDRSIRQPELIFSCRTPLTREAVADRLDHREHDGLIAIATNPNEVARWRRDPRLTPIAAATMALWQHSRQGCRG